MKTAAVAIILAALIAGSCSIEPVAYCAPDSGQSAVRIWNEQLLDAIRRDFPAPTVHSRNLFHLSALAWDASALLTGETQPVLATRALAASVPPMSDAAVSAVISHGSHTLLTHRYANAVGAEESLAAFDRQLELLCLAKVNDDAARFGDELAQQIIESTREDGSNEASGYADFNYAPVNPPLIVSSGEIVMVDPNRWQPLSLAEQRTQNDQPLPGALQTFVGPNWGAVTGFALPPSDDLLRIDPGPPPLLGEGSVYEDQALEVVRYSSWLDSTRPDTVSVGAKAVNRGDYGRVIAEYWADGPESETPPGHWNTLANEIGDRIEAMGALKVNGEKASRLDWDIHTGLALNAALHDTAIAVWGSKAHFDYVRPISMIRLLSSEGRLPLEPGLSELITVASSAAGERHEHLAEYIGETTVLAWKGSPIDPERETAGVGWIRGAEWLPYQRPSFVTPAFAAYASGHSGFSRAAARILEFATGSDIIPGGELTWAVEPGGLIHESGPSQTVTLVWPKFSDAAEEAGISRIYGGIHVRADHLAGVEIGDRVAGLVWQRVQALSQ